MVEFLSCGYVPYVTLLYIPTAHNFEKILVICIFYKYIVASFLIVIALVADAEQAISVITGLWLFECIYVDMYVCMYAFYF